LEQWIFHKRKLGKNYDGTKNRLVIKQLVAIKFVTVKPSSVAVAVVDVK
jgi:hypothetical protein